MAYVPSGPDPDFRFYSACQAYYSERGVTLDMFYDLDREHSRAEVEALFAYQAIHLSGGNTAGFLSRLRRSNMLDRLRIWARNGGLLIGISAGAMLMTPTIAVDALYGGGCPDDGGDGAALGLVPFEFFPHLQAKPGYLEDLRSYSARSSQPIIACPDGGGIVIVDGVAELFGDLLWLSEGTVVPMAGTTFGVDSSGERLLIAR